MAGDRTEQATPQRRERARKEGDLLHSRELCSAAGMLAGVIVLGASSSRLVASWREALPAFLSFGTNAMWETDTQESTQHSLLNLGLMVLTPMAWMAACVAAAALLAGVVQTGGVQMHPQLIQPRFDRINPVNNLKNLVSLRSAARLGKSMIPATLLAVFAIQQVGKLIALPVFSMTRVTEMGHAAYGLLLVSAWMLFGWSAIDYLVEWRSREQRLKMSRQEMREEFKDSEGNPQIRARIRNLQRLARRRRLQTDVSRAAVVVTNPTHYAVALEFDFDSMEAPRVLAKGMNLVAEEIKQQARWAGVPMMENAPLARSLYRLVEPGQAIPAELYAAVASILAYLYRQRVEEQVRRRRERAAESGAHRAAAATPDAGSAVRAVIPADRTVIRRAPRKVSRDSDHGSGGGQA